MTKIVGITGGIASGKTMISDYLIDRGYPLLDADVIARQVLTEKQSLLTEIKDAFGTEVFDKQGQLLRRHLGEIIFADPKKRAQLNDIMQPAIRQLIEDKLRDLQQKSYPLIFLTVPLLYEQHYESLCDAVIVVYVTPKTQQLRLQKRDQLSSSEAAQRIAAQMPLQLKADRADFVIDNNVGQDSSLQQLQMVLARLQE